MINFQMLTQHWIPGKITSFSPSHYHCVTDGVIWLESLISKILPTYRGILFFPLPLSFLFWILTVFHIMLMWPYKSHLGNIISMIHFYYQLFIFLKYLIDISKCFCSGIFFVVKWIENQLKVSSKFRAI